MPRDFVKKNCANGTFTAVVGSLQQSNNVTKMTIKVVMKMINQKTDLGTV